MIPETHLPGAFVMSLDFELRWGVRHRHVGATYDARLLGARRAIPRILSLFTEFNVAAAWATVGFLFARSRAEREAFNPRLRPAYHDTAFSAYTEQTGESEADDPLHYAPSLIEAIRQTPKQEIATHTYSHYFALERGQTADSFAADLQAAQAIAADRGVRLTSIVLPRNQREPAYDQIMLDCGITAYRGNPRSHMWRFADGADGDRRGKRLARLLDAYVPIDGHNTLSWHDVVQPSGLCDVRASCFLRPYDRRLDALEGLKLRRIRTMMRAAAERGEIFHLWWHPHNFGAYTDANLALLRAILAEYTQCRVRWGMQSLSMAQVAHCARAGFDVRLPVTGADERREVAPMTGSTRRLLHVTTIPMSLVFLRGQVGYMQRRGIDVSVLSSPGPDLYAFGRTHGVRTYAVDMRREITPLRDIAALSAMLRVVRSLQPHIVHAHTPKGGLLGMLAAALGGVPLRVYHMRGLPMATASGWRRGLLWLTEWIACWLAHRVLCVSHSLRRIAVDARVCPASKIEVPLGGSGNGVDALQRFNPATLPPGVREETRAQFAIPANARVIGFVGRLVRDKGIVELAEAWRSLREQFPQAHLLLVGPLESQDPIPRDIEDALRGDDRVHFAGMDWNTAPLYAAMDVVALPTYREGFPNVPLEAAAMGLPVVATRIPGCTDAIVDGATGTLVPSRDAGALATALATYLRDRALAERHGEAGRERVLREFGQERIWEHIYNEYNGSRLERQPAISGGIASAMKRTLDIVGAAVGLLLLAPLLLVIAIVVRVALGAPVLFRQVRPGLNGQPFALYKFRTMREAAAPDGRLLPDAARLTSVGRVLRSWSVDELPELWNVIKGDMSLVGPRPLLMEYLPLFTSSQARRHDVRPGITGWAQVSGRNALTWEERLALDVWYVDHRSLALDLRILLRTVATVFARHGVAHPGHATMERFRGTPT